MLKMFLDWPALIILYAFCVILALFYIMCRLPDKWTNKKIFMGPFIFLCLSIIFVSIVFTPIIFFLTKQPISNKAWKQVYTNNENASVEISFEDGYQEKYSIKAGEDSSDNIQKLYNKLNGNSVVYNVKITVSQGKNKLTKVVATTKDNFVRKKVDLNNSLISKIEYRPIEGFARKVFGETGEIKITLGSSENKKLNEIFEEKCNCQNHWRR